MDKALVFLGSLVAILLVGQGVWKTAHAQPGLMAPRSAGASPGRVAGATVGDVLRQFGAAPPKPLVPVGSQELDWALLTGYEYQVGLLELPDAIKALEGKTVTMRGFLMPLYEFDDIHEFILVPTHMSCCFGMPTGINGQVQIRLEGARGLPNTNEPIEVTGTFHATETKEQGYVLSIFRLDGAKARIVGY